MIARASSGDSAERRAALEGLCRAYWWPLYAYLRKRGYSSDVAADFLQGLFADIIEKDRFAHADPTRGRFRSWLLTALKYHLSHEREREHAAKRGGHPAPIPLDRAEAERRWEGSAPRDDDPERVFERAWGMAVLDAALRRLEEEYERDGKAELYRALKLCLTSDPGRQQLQSIAEQLGLTVPAVKSAAVRLRMRMHEATRAEVRATLGELDDVDEDMRALFSALSTG